MIEHFCTIFTRDRGEILTETDVAFGICIREPRENVKFHFSVFPWFWFSWGGAVLGRMMQWKRRGEKGRSLHTRIFGLPVE